MKGYQLAFGGILLSLLLKTPISRADGAEPVKKAKSCSSLLAAAKGAAQALGQALWAPVSWYQAGPQDQPLLNYLSYYQGQEKLFTADAHASLHALHFSELGNLTGEAIERMNDQLAAVKTLSGKNALNDSWTLVRDLQDQKKLWAYLTAKESQLLSATVDYELATFEWMLLNCQSDDLSLWAAESRVQAAQAKLIVAEYQWALYERQALTIENPEKLKETIAFLYGDIEREEKLYEEILHRKTKNRKTADQQAEKLIAFRALSPDFNRSIQAFTENSANREITIAVRTP